MFSFTSSCKNKIEEVLVVEFVPGRYGESVLADSSRSADAASEILLLPLHDRGLLLLLLCVWCRGRW